jgi:hypothetical protein
MKKCIYFCKEGELIQWPAVWVSLKRLYDICIVSVILSGKHPLVCGTIANTDQHLDRISNLRTILFFYTHTKQYLGRNMLLNQEISIHWNQ